MNIEAKQELKLIYNKVVELAEKLDNKRLDDYTKKQIKRQLHLVNKEDYSSYSDDLLYSDLLYNNALHYEDNLPYVAYNDGTYFIFTFDLDYNAFRIEELLGNNDGYDYIVDNRLSSIYKTNNRLEVIYIILEDIIYSKVYELLREKYSSEELDLWDCIDETSEITKYQSKLTKEFINNLPKDIQEACTYLAENRYYNSIWLSNQEISLTKLLDDNYWKSNIEHNKNNILNLED